MAGTIHPASTARTSAQSQAFFCNQEADGRGSTQKMGSGARGEKSARVGYSVFDNHGACSFKPKGDSMNPLNFILRCWIEQAALGPFSFLTTEGEKMTTANGQTFCASTYWEMMR